MGHAPPHLPEDKVKEMLCAKVDTYLHERIELADLAILGYATQRIAPGDVLLVYSRSLVIEKILLAAHRQGVEYRVIVADAGPRFEGRDMVKRLLAAGVTCDYVNLHAVSYVMAEVGKVLLGCSSMLLNGTLVGRAGTALIAMLAHERGVPVLVRTRAHMPCAARVCMHAHVQDPRAHGAPVLLCIRELQCKGAAVHGKGAGVQGAAVHALQCKGVGKPEPERDAARPTRRTPDPPHARPAARPLQVCCETYKFTERVLLDAICYNELGDPDDLVGADGPVADWRDMPQLKLLNLMYDVTPTKFITMVVTEAGVIPPTSVPVIIREDIARSQLATDHTGAL